MSCSDIWDGDKGGGAKGQNKKQAKSRYLKLLQHAEPTVSGRLGFHFHNHCDIHVWFLKRIRCRKVWGGCNPKLWVFKVAWKLWWAGYQEKVHSYDFSQLYKIIARALLQTYIYTCFFVATRELFYWWNNFPIFINIRNNTESAKV